MAELTPEQEIKEIWKLIREGLNVLSMAIKWRLI
jgi:hypothetical protein